MIVFYLPLRTSFSHNISLSNPSESEFHFNSKQVVHVHMCTFDPHISHPYFSSLSTKKKKENNQVTSSY